MRSLLPSIANSLLDLRWPGYKAVKSEVQADTRIVVLEARTHQAICPHCGRVCTRHHSFQLRRAVDAPLYPFQKLIIEYTAERFRCSCGHTCTQQPSFIEPRAKITNTMVLYAQQLLRVACLSMTSVAQLTRLSWGTLRKLDKAQLKFCYETLNLSGVQNIAIDEFSVHKNHKYATVVIDNDNCRVIWIGKGKSRASVQPFFDMLKKRGLAGNIRSVACDQNAAYPSLVKDNIPQATIVYDLFHVLANWRRLVLAEAKKQTQLKVAQRLREEAIEKAQKEQRKLNKQELRCSIQKAMSTYTGIDWMMVRNPEDIKEEPKGQKLLATLQADNALLAALYPITESLRQLWRTKNPKESERLLTNLSALLLQIKRTYDFKPAKSFAMMLKRRCEGITKAGKFGYSTSRLEGVNNRIKVIKRVGFGYTDLEYFFLKIKSVLSGKYAVSMYDKLDGFAIIGNKQWSGPWKPSLAECCLHAQM